MAVFQAAFQLVTMLLTIHQSNPLSLRMTTYL